MTKTAPSSHMALPAGYAVAQSHEKQWYALCEDRYYSIEYPEGIPFYLETCQDFDSFTYQYSRRAEAVQGFWRHARWQEAKEPEQVERLAAHSEVFPERCAHYLDIIEEV